MLWHHVTVVAFAWITDSLSFRFLIAQRRLRASLLRGDCETESVAVSCLAPQKPVFHHPALTVPTLPGLCIGQDRVLQCPVQQCSPLSLSFLGLILFPRQSCKVLESRSCIVPSSACPPGPAPASLWVSESHADCLLRNRGEWSHPSLPPLSPLLQSGLPPEKAQYLPSSFPAASTSLNSGGGVETRSRFRPWLLLESPLQPAELHPS